MNNKIKRPKLRPININGMWDIVMEWMEWIEWGVWPVWVVWQNEKAKTQSYCHDWY